MDVIVVDDEPGVQEFVRLALLREGATCRASALNYWPKTPCCGSN